jgi:type IV pilus assembly protein PilM
MVSIDITDKQIKLVSGSLSGSKIKISKAGTREVPEGSIVNGYVNNIPAVSAEITAMLEFMKISEKEVTACINSSSILYKELELLKPKTLKNHTAIEAMIITEMQIANDYNVSYTIVGEGQTAGGESTIKVMATACPQRLVDTYQALFVQLGLKLKQINISNNCITRLIVHSPRLKDDMPFLCIQIDTDFININLFESGQLVLARYIKIDPADFDNNPDYVNIAVFDNLFRMIQFIEQRPNTQKLKNILFYGEIRDFVSLSNSIASFNIPSRQFAKPDNIGLSSQDIEFTKYANAIGAFHKVDPLIEHVNLLQSKAVKSKQSSNMFPLQVLGVAVVGAAIVGGVLIGIAAHNNDLIAQREAVQEQITKGRFSEREAEMKLASTILNNFTTYKNSVELSQILFDFQPRGNLPQIKEQIYAGATEVALVRAQRRAQLAANPDVPLNRIAEDTFYAFHHEEWNLYGITLIVYTGDVDGAADYVEALNKLEFFENILHVGYEFIPRTEARAVIPAGQGDIVRFTLTMRLRGGHIFVGEEESGTLRDNGQRVYAPPATE